MNLSGIVQNGVSVVTPLINAQLMASNGYSTSADGTQTPIYAAPQNVQIQVQALQYNDVEQLDGLNIQGERRSVYLQGAWDGVIRADKRGGDLLTFPEYAGGPSRTWLVVFVFEHWNTGTTDWSRLCVTLQDDQHL